MADLKLFVTENKELDIDIFNNDFVGDDSLETSVFISLTKHRYDSETALNGWAGEEILIGDVPFGSRLYLAMQGNITENELNLVNKYVYESLQWMIDDSVAKEITVNVERINTNMAGFSVTIFKPDNITEKFEYFLNWQAQRITRV